MEVKIKMLFIFFLRSQKRRQFKKKERNWKNALNVFLRKKCTLFWKNQGLFPIGAKKVGALSGDFLLE